MEETVIQKILGESYNVCNLQCVKLLIKPKSWYSGKHKNRG